MQHDCPHNTNSGKRLAIIGAGPIGIELALFALQHGMTISVFECGESVGAQVLLWKHVMLFSPWSMNTSDQGRRVLEENGLKVPDCDAFSNGADFVARYLQPLAEHIRKHPSCNGLTFNARVISIGRGALLKSESIGGGDLQMPKFRPQAKLIRSATPFRLLVSHGGSSVSERYHEGFDFVCDCSGCYRLLFFLDVFVYACIYIHKCTFNCINLCLSMYVSCICISIIWCHLSLCHGIQHI